eukprot:CAMPEP_0177315972 /NCGR_PEP_ID=MMETSP0368-20130122/12743_1 /TAXON_ID=447022 ORGANISM="Scrippsiella hangoei-like, Strain SHHI-4" /NCGR_SAMPLE_ID=MMETSP0368 /ASSEMBLY_ACC=CAM_ASM_000363 /LENGTH=158 /DNA_ID=CAMNT_0018775205 /DNA_START=70 /DNA_END=547 /DNA_ORIENTATION=-
MGNACTETKKGAEEVPENIEHGGINAAQAAKDAAEAAARAAEKVQEAAQAAKDIKEKGIAQAAQEAAKAAADDEKGAMQKVDFKTKKIGMSFALGGSGCCGPVGPAKVVVTKIDKDSQAETLGVMPKWSIKSVNGVEVTGFSRAEKMLKEGAAKLSDA